MTGFPDDAARTFERLWNDASLSMDEVLARLETTHAAASWRASVYRAKGLHLIDRRKGCQPKQGVPAYTVEQGAEIIRLTTEQGMKREQVAARLGIPGHRVKAVLTFYRQDGEVPRKLTRRRKDDGPKITVPETDTRPAPPPRSVGHAAGILTGKGEEVTFERHGGHQIIRVGGVIVTVPRLFELAYGEPAGKFR